tara:strand:+ start:833 stop:1933 length:1101 start_codon:yes stop_codon:yes gene_type:complete
MDEKYIINDIRDHTQFKDKTYSNFKKSQVLNAVFKSIESKKVEQACHWTTECILSGYSNILWEKIILFTSKVIHINNPRIPGYILKKTTIMNNQISLLDKKSKDIYLLLRNSQMIRNLFFDVVTTLCMSLKTKRYDNYPKINEQEDFKYENMKKRLCGQMNILPSHIIKFNDPDDITIIINEIFTMLKNKQFGYERCCFWILWLLKWESLHKKKNIPWNIDYREIKEINQKYRCNIIWIIWNIIMEEVTIRDNKDITIQINNLYKLFTMDYTPGKRNKRLPLIFNAIGYLTHEINFSIPIRNNIKLFIDVQCNVNKMFASKKETEIVNKEPIHKKLKKKETVDVEIIQDKMSIFNELDKVITPTNN